jgi:hypothetical protein
MSQLSFTDTDGNSEFCVPETLLNEVKTHFFQLVNCLAWQGTNFQNPR